MRLAITLIAVLLASPCHAQRLGIAAYAVVSAADLAQTIACVARGTCHEANPILRPLVGHPMAYGAVGGDGRWRGGRRAAQGEQDAPTGHADHGMGADGGEGGGCRVGDET